MFDIQGTSDKAYKRELEVYETYDNLRKEDKMPDKQVKSIDDLDELAKQRGIKFFDAWGRYRIKYNNIYRIRYEELVKRNGDLINYERHSLILKQHDEIYNLTLEEIRQEIGSE